VSSSFKFIRSHHNVVATSYFKLFEIQLVMLMEDVKKLQSEGACEKWRTAQDIAERIGCMMGTGFTATQSEFMLGILATLVQLVLVKILLFGS